MSRLQREHGFGAFGFVRFLVIVVVIFMLVGSAGQCAQRAPQVAGDAASELGQAAGNAAAGMLSSVVQSVTCALPLVNCASNSNLQPFTQCLKSTAGAPYPCTSYGSDEQAATTALALARLGTKCFGVEFVGLVYSYEAGGAKQITFVGPFAQRRTSGDFGTSVAALERLKIPLTVEAMYHSHPAEANARFSLGDIGTAVSSQKPSYLVGTNTLGDGEVRRYTPNKTPLPQGWNPQPAKDSLVDNVLYNWLNWKELQEEWYDWFPTLGDAVYLGDLKDAGELVDRARQCPSRVY